MRQPAPEVGLAALWHPTRTDGRQAGTLRIMEGQSAAGSLPPVPFRAIPARSLAGTQKNHRTIQRHRDARCPARPGEYRPSTAACCSPMAPCHQSDRRSGQTGEACIARPCRPQACRPDGSSSPEGARGCHQPDTATGARYGSDTRDAQTRTCREGRSPCPSKTPPCIMSCQRTGSIRRRHPVPRSAPSAASARLLRRH